MTRKGDIYRSVRVSLRNAAKLWHLFSKDKVAVACVSYLVLVIMVAIFAPFIAKYNPLETAVAKPFVSPDLEYPMGTDDLGRDIFSGWIYGARTSLLVGFTVAIISTFIGIVIGATSGYIGGKLDDILMRITELFLTIPTLILALVIVALWGSNFVNIILVLAILSWPSTARLCRSEFLHLKEKGFVEAAKSIGERDLTVVFREILPNALPTVIVSASVQVAAAILWEASLSFLGLGDPNVTSWGKMLYNAQQFLGSSWWMAVFPGMAILLTCLSLNHIGDALNDVLNPRLRGR